MRLSLALVVGLGAAGCTQDVELWPFGDDAGTDAAPTCTPNGGSCTGSLPCCSGRCRTSVCVADVCAVVGEPCASSLECCGGMCSAGTCAVFSGCAPTGEPCDAPGDCCSRVCAEDATGRLVCQGLGGCRQAGELCSAGIECCGGVCDVFDPVLGIGRCAVTTSCARVGEVCRAEGDPSSDRTCCTTGAPAPSLCRPSDVQGVSRCVSDTIAPGECLADGVSCAGPIDCCGGSCIPSTSGAFFCASGCVPQSGDCSRDADCCGLACNGAGRCSGSSSCLPLARACRSADACCSGVCGTSGECVPAPF